MSEQNAYPGVRVQAGHLFNGYAQAVARFGVGIRATQPDLVYFALFESLNWVVALDDYIRAVWAPAGKTLDWDWRERAGGSDLAQLLNGARFARNLVHHHWADALYNDEGKVYQERYGSTYFSWCWRQSAGLPDHPGAGNDPNVVRNALAYSQRFADRQAFATFDDLSPAFDRLKTFLNSTARAAPRRDA